MLGLLPSWTYNPGSVWSAPIVKTRSRILVVFCFVKHDIASTSTLCAIKINGVETSTSDPTGCGLVGNSDVQYNLSAAASTSVSGGVIGSIGASIGFEEAINVTRGPDPLSWPQAQAHLATKADITAEFTTPGPLRTGTLTYMANGYQFSGGPYTREPFLLLRGGVKVSDGINNLSESSYCYEVRLSPPYYYFCPTFTIPIQLGSSISIEAFAYAEFSSFYGPFFDSNSESLNESGTFTVQEKDGTPVNATLVSVPEPSTYAFVAAFLSLLAVSRGFARLAA